MFWMQQDPQAKKGTLSRNITIRNGTKDDEYATFDVMRKTMGHEMVWSHHAAVRHHLQTSEGSCLWIAEERQRFASARIIGYSRSVVRDSVWSLTEFFVLPGHHRQGVGSALLERSLEHGERSGARARLVLASQHPAADSLYVRKLGCYPRLPMMMVVGPLSKLRPPEFGGSPIVETTLAFTDPALARQAAQAAGEMLRAEPLVLTEETRRTVDTLDRRIVGYARPQEHAFWAREMGGMAGASRLFRHSRRDADGSETLGEICGYVYIGAHSSGPGLAEEPEDLPHMLAHVSTLSRALAHSDNEFELLQPLEQYWALAGSNEKTLRWLLDCGWQIVFHYLFMSSHPLGSLDRYVGYNPLYFL